MLSVLPGHEPRRRAGAGRRQRFDRLRLVGRRERAGPRERAAQHAVAEHLRRLRLPEPDAVLGAQRRAPASRDPRASACRRPESRAGRRPRRRRARSRAAAALRVGTQGRAASCTSTQSSSSQRAASARSALATVSAREAPPQRSVSTPSRVSDDALVELVVRRQRDDGRGERRASRRAAPAFARATAARRDRVLLRQRAAEAAAAAGRRNERDEARQHRFALALPAGSIDAVITAAAQSVPRRAA